MIIVLRGVGILSFIVEDIVVFREHKYSGY